MNLDIELFLRDEIEKILRENEDYNTINVKAVIKIEGGTVSFEPYVNPY